MLREIIVVMAWGIFELLFVSFLTKKISAALYLHYLWKGLDWWVTDLEENSTNLSIVILRYILCCWTKNVKMFSREGNEAKNTFLLFSNSILNHPWVYCTTWREHQSMLWKPLGSYCLVYLSHVWDRFEKHWQRDSVFTRNEAIFEFFHDWNKGPFSRCCLLHFYHWALD